MAATVLNHKHIKFAESFVQTRNLVDAAKTAGLRAKEAYETLVANKELQDIIKRLIEMDAVAANYVSDDHLKLKLYNIAMDDSDEANMTHRLKAAALYFDIGKKGGDEDTKQKLEEVGKLLENVQSTTEKDDG